MNNISLRGMWIDNLGVQLMMKNYMILSRNGQAIMSPNQLQEMEAEYKKKVLSHDHPVLRYMVGDVQHNDN